MFQKKISIALLIMIMSAFTACGQQQNVEVEEYTRQESSAIEEDNNTEEEKDTQETENGEKNKKAPTSIHGRRHCQPVRI